MGKARGVSRTLKRSLKTHTKNQPRKEGQIKTLWRNEKERTGKAAQRKWRTGMENGGRKKRERIGYGKEKSRTWKNAIRQSRWEN
jgi:hypothetical protein